MGASTSQIGSRIGELLMISDTIIAIIVAVGTPILLGLTLLPTILELINPSDAGPRLIVYDSSTLSDLSQLTMVPLVDIEEQYKVQLAPLPAINEVIKVLPSMEP